jgi:hypothetical protein
VLGELGILLGGFSEGKAVQLRVDLNRLHATIIPSRVESAFTARPSSRHYLVATRRKGLSVPNPGHLPGCRQSGCCMSNRLPPRLSTPAGRLSVSQAVGDDQRPCANRVRRYCLS